MMMKTTTLRWADDDGTELPELPWLKKEHQPVWGSLKKQFYNFNCFMDPLDRATEFYLTSLWNEKVVACIIKSNEERHFRWEMKSLDDSTEIYLGYYWKAKVEEAKKQSPEQEWTVFKKRGKK